MITLLKCETCGASDFEKHELIDEFLVCSSCGNQYLKQIRQISTELPVNLKVELKGNNNKHVVSNSIIRGNNNKVIGSYNVVIGNNNVTKGEGNITKGNNNVNKS